MFRVILLGFLIFTFSFIVAPAPAYAISLDDDEEDTEDVEDLVQQAKKAADAESFAKADSLIKKAGDYQVSTDTVDETRKYIARKRQEREARLERQAELERQRQTSRQNRYITSLGYDHTTAQRSCQVGWD